MRKLGAFKMASFVLALIAVVMMVVGFIVPPTGVIDGSVLTGAGIMLGFAALFFAWHAVDKGLDAKITHGSTTVEINNDEE